MRAMIFGDIASGKSTFANQLGEITDTPVIHLDEIMEEIGREHRESIGEAIRTEADKPHWIIEGNAFTKDETYRIDKASQVFVFDFEPAQALVNHLERFKRLAAGLEARIGGTDQRLNLPYYLPYIFDKFPPRKRAAMQYAEDSGKELTVFKSRTQASAYLLSLTVEK